MERVLAALAHGAAVDGRRTAHGHERESGSSNAAVTFSAAAVPALHALSVSVSRLPGRASTGGSTRNDVSSPKKSGAERTVSEAGASSNAGVSCDATPARATTTAPSANGASMRMRYVSVADAPAGSVRITTGA